MHFDDSENEKQTLPIYIENLIDEAVSLDFDIYPISDEDRANENFQNFKYSLEISNIEIVYLKKVISKNHAPPIVPKIQYLFGIRPVDGLCIYSNNEIHKKVLCSNEILDLMNSSSSIIHSFMYLIVEHEEFNVWSYIPLDPLSSRVDEQREDLKLRKKLFTKVF